MQSQILKAKGASSEELLIALYLHNCTQLIDCANCVPLFCAARDEFRGYEEQLSGSENILRSALERFSQKQDERQQSGESGQGEENSKDEARSNFIERLREFSMSSSEGEGSGSVREEVQKRLEEGTQNAEEELERVVSEISSRSSSSESSPGEEDQGEIGSESASPEEARSSREEVQQRLEELNRYVVLLWRIVHHGSWFLRCYILSG
jgi:chromosome segregation ATPase